MRIQLDAVKETGLKIEFGLDPLTDEGLSAVVQSGEARFLGPVHAQLDLHPVSDTIEVRGRLSVLLRLSCARCLTEFEQPVDCDLRCTYAPRPPERQHPKAGDLELSADDVGLIFFDGHAIDLSEAVREEILAAIPYRALCQPECRGLCPHCGANLNTETCDCAAGRIDPRLAGLTRLKNQLKT